MRLRTLAIIIVIILAVVGVGLYFLLGRDTASPATPGSGPSLTGRHEISAAAVQGYIQSLLLSMPWPSTMTGLPSLPCSARPPMVMRYLPSPQLAYWNASEVSRAVPLSPERSSAADTAG